MKNLFVVLALLSNYLFSPLLVRNSNNYNLQFLRDTSAGDSNIRILENYDKLISVDQLLEKFKGKPVFIDLWATWCEPCLEEFKYMGRLQPFLEKRKIEMIYISFDAEDLEATWKKAIYKNHLLGNHIRANKKLRDGLSVLIWGAKDGYSIPHYLLFDKKGKLLDKNVPQPSEGSKLYNDVESKLNN